MTASRLDRYWILITILLVAIIITGGMVAWSRYSPSRPIEISIPPGEELWGKIYIGGNVTTPGFYPFVISDTVEALFQAAGGTTSGADLNGLRLYIPGVGEEPVPQKVDINRAEVWLLEALHGVGETLAQRIIDYRQQNGPFCNTKELLGVAGIGTTTYEQIEHLITVADE